MADSRDVIFVLASSLWLAGPTLCLAQKTPSTAFGGSTFANTAVVLSFLVVLSILLLLIVLLMLRKRRLDQQLEEEQRFREAFTYSGIGMALVGLEGQWLQVNPRICEILGYSETELLKSDFQSVTHPEDLDKDMEQLDQLRHGHIPFYRINKRYQHHDGGWVHARLTVSPVKNARGQLQHYFSQIEDVTEEHVISEKARRFQAAVDSSADAIFLIDPETMRFLDANRTARESIQRSQDEILQLGPHDIKPHWTREALQKGFQEIIDQQTPGTINTWHQRADGSEFPVEVMLYPFIDETRTLLVAAARDLSLVHEIEQTYSWLIQNMDEGFCLVDESGHLLETNQAYLHLTGRDVATLTNSPDLGLILPEDQNQLLQNIEAALDGSSARLQIHHHHPERGLLDLEVHATLLPMAKRRLGIFFQDQTQQHQAHRKLETLNVELQRSNDELQQFAYVVSHDLQEPLRMVASFTQLLEENYGQLIDEKGRRWMQFSLDGANRMRRLLEDLLTYSRVASQRTPPEAIDLHEILDMVRQNLDLMIEENEALITQEDPLPIVLAQESHLLTLFQNLISNAIKYRRPSVPPQIHLGFVDLPVQNGVPMVEITVRDNGIGIDPKYHEKIFVIFQRLHGRSEGDGTGIGLALCKRIVEINEGKIWLDSEPGIGSTFHLTLPMATAR